MTAFFLAGGSKFISSPILIRLRFLGDSEWTIGRRSIFLYFDVILRLVCTKV